MTDPQIHEMHNLSQAAPAGLADPPRPRLSLAQTWRSCTRWGFTVQVPVRRAAERDAAPEGDH
ncbi:mobile element protein [Streptomyces azureus]|uniref:Mobile element protein n=1 Tax=Streptomyces azureus TaxID=146537 RepID=A0A0K8PW09_STRAJ|nr:mobile element protein [Streptomyces azureus]